MPYAFFAVGADFFRVLKPRYGCDILKTDSFDLRHNGMAAHAEHKLVIKKFFFFAGIQIFRKDILFLRIDFKGFGLDLHMVDIFYMGEKMRVADNIGACGAQFINTVHFGRNIKRHAAAAVGNKLSLVYNGDFGIGIYPFTACGGFCSKSDSSDDKNFLSHNNSFYLRCILCQK